LETIVILYKCYASNLVYEKNIYLIFLEVVKKFIQRDRVYERCGCDWLLGLSWWIHCILCFYRELRRVKMINRNNWVGILVGPHSKYSTYKELLLPQKEKFIKIFKYIY